MYVKIASIIVCFLVILYKNNMNHNLKYFDRVIINVRKFILKTY